MFETSDAGHFELMATALGATIRYRFQEMDQATETTWNRLARSLREDLTVQPRLEEGVVLVGQFSWNVKVEWILDEQLPILNFLDGSREFLNSPSSIPPSDEGPDLLLPVSATEHAAIERLLTLLWQGAANDGLTDAQERMVLSIAGMIEKSHRETELGSTPRWKLVGAVGAGLGYLFLNVPAGVIAWNEAIPILQGIDWPNVARLVGGG